MLSDRRFRRSRLFGGQDLGQGADQSIEDGMALATMLANTDRTTVLAPSRGGWGASGELLRYNTPRSR
jgi:hypothetical protein